MKETKMKATKTAKKPSRSSGKSPLDQRLLAYALGGGALALAATPAEAAVIWSGIQNISVPSLGGGTVTNPNVSNGVAIPMFPETGSPQFYFGWGGNSTTGDSQIFGAIVDSGGQLGGLICTGAPVSLNNFTLGQTFGPTSPAKDWTGYDPNATPKTKGNKSTVFPNYNAIGLFSSYASDNSYDASASGVSANFGTPIPQWAAGATGYAGFVLEAGNDAYYGWVQVNVPTTAAPGENATLVQWAIESSPSTAIQIGATSSVPEIDPASGGSALALLVGGLALVEQQLGFAAGAAGLRAWRKRRQSKNGDGSDFSG
jgi:hypothetical protein